MPEFHAVFMDDSFANPEKTAVQCPLGRNDSYLVNGEKHLIMDDFEHGLAVEKVISRIALKPQQFAVGGYLMVRSFNGVEAIYGRILRIRMMHTDHLMLKDYRTLGFEDAADYQRRTGGLNQGLVWMFDVDRRDVPKRSAGQSGKSASKQAKSDRLARTS
jgi:hypothetical protein